MEPEDEVDRKYYLSEEAVSKMVIATEKDRGQVGCVKDHGKIRDVPISLMIGANYWKGPDNHAQRTLVRSVLTPDRPEKRQMGRRMKEDGEPSFTLTGQDIHGVAIQAKSILFPGRAEHGQPRRRVKEDGEPTFALTGQVVHGVAVRSTFSPQHTNIHQERRFKEEGEPSFALTAFDQHGVAFTPLQPDQIGRTVRKGGRDTMSNKHNCNIVQRNQWQIRKLTPTECERLQGFPDGWTEGVSDTQRYKTLGNAVTTTVVSAVMKKLFRKEV